MTENELPKPNPHNKKILGQIQEIIGRKLEQVFEVQWRGTQGYSINYNGEVVNLGLCEYEITNKKLQILIEKLFQLRNLTTLYLFHNQLTDISVLKELPNLTQLVLSDNQLTNISPLTELTNLTLLDLRSNQLTDISSLKKLSKLTQLFLSDNQLKDISSLKDLSKLTQLLLSNNRLADISSLKKLSNLTEIDLSDNQLTDISSLKELLNLTQLYLRSNKLTDISPLKELPNLTQLYLRSNQLTDISPLKELSNLILLDLHNNKIKKVPIEMFEKDWKVYYKDGYLWKGINLYGNPLEIPPLEIVKQGRDAILNYFKSLETAEGKGEEVVRLYEAKLLVVGPGGVGKTFLSNRLIYGKTPPTNTTEGIDIHKWTVRISNIDNFRINLWDFGGQEIYHATHQFFLTKRSLYLFVWEARKDDDRVSFSYWLNVIKLLSNSAPIIMVMNKCDERRKAIDQAAIQKQFPNVIGFYEVSADKNICINELKNRTIKEIGNLEQIGTTLPKQWVKIREQLERMREEGQKYITYNQYKEICCSKIYGLYEEQAGYLSGYYHELGIILYFAENPVLKDIVFLNPEWATNAVYVLTDYDPVKRNFGRFHFDELKGVWKDYPEDKYAALLELMMKFELCFNLEGTDEYIIPELLRPERRYFVWNYQDNLYFQYKYDFMPAGIITRFMVRKHNLIKDDLYWKNGVVMEWEGTKALIESNEFDEKIDIWINGEDKKGLLSIIRCDIQHIHETLNKPVVFERMPCICSECKETTKPYFYNYQDLRTLLRKNIQNIRCMKSAIEIPIDILLGTYGIYEEDQIRHSKQDIHGDLYHCNIYGDQNEVLSKSISKIERINMLKHKKTINIGKGSTIKAPLVIADHIENSFNSVAKSDINEEVKDLMKQLITDVTEISKNIPKENAESMARDVESLSKEVTSSKPRRKWYEMSIEGLKDAARAVGEVGKPILVTTAKLLPLLNKIWNS